MTDRDFPFYDGSPIVLSGAQWLLVLAFCAAGFAVLSGLPSTWSGQIGHWAAVLLFLGLPLLGLRLAAGRAWTALFPRLRARDVWIGLAFAPLTMMVAAGVAVVVAHTSVTVANPAMGLMDQLRGLDLFLFLASTAPQLLGEEVITILPFLAILTLFQHRLKTSRRSAIIAAWGLSALLFGALHLSTYGWNIAQALGIIAVSRLMLSLPFMITKSIWSSTIAHVTHDWMAFAVVAGLTALKASSGGA